MVRGKLYKHLGQLIGIRHSDIKMEVRDKFLSLVNRGLKTSLNAGNNVRTINTPVDLQFWNSQIEQTDPEHLERSMRKAFREDQNAPSLIGTEEKAYHGNKGGFTAVRRQRRADPIYSLHVVRSLQLYSRYDSGYFRH